MTDKKRSGKTLAEWEVSLSWQKIPLNQAQKIIFSKSVSKYCHEPLVNSQRTLDTCYGNTGGYGNTF